MTDERTNAIAREAARLLDTGQARTVGAAIDAAVSQLGHPGAHRPGEGLVRKHAEAMSMQALGDQGHRAAVRAVLETAETVLTTIEHDVPEARAYLMGRAARGQVDGGVTLHVRVCTERPMRDVALALVERGYEEPKFETADTRVGRLDRIRFVEDGLEVVVMRCPPSIPTDLDLDLFSGKRVPHATADDLRRRIDE